jgi:hypothetical protein
MNSGAAVWQFFLDIVWRWWTLRSRVLVLVWGHIPENGSIEHSNMCVTEDFLALSLIT